MQKIGKNNPLASEIEKSNQLCKEWNQLIDEVLAEEVVEKDELSVYKYRQINEVLEGEVKTHGWNKSIFPDVLQGATRKLYELLLIVKEYHQVHCVKSFSIPDETLAEIKQKKASKFHKMDWRQATPRKQRYIPYKKMTPYQKWEFQKMQEHKRLYGEKSLIDRGNRKR
jgi:tRNA uridine 5-carbamoylmethylation protein Kti12